MTKEMLVLQWCDHPDCAGERRPAEHEDIVHPVGKKPHLVDTCAVHHDLLAYLHARGAPPPEQPTPDTVPPCPECGSQKPSRSALGTHLKDHHGKGIRDYPELKLK